MGGKQFEMMTVSVYVILVRTNDKYLYILYLTQLVQKF